MRWLRSAERVSTTLWAGVRLFRAMLERWIGSCRREMLDHIIVLDERHLRRLLREYARYHNEDRIHDALNKDAPNGRPVDQRPSPAASIILQPRLGGLHHRYSWSVAA